jgi:hypothetical protein
MTRARVRRREAAGGVSAAPAATGLHAAHVRCTNAMRLRCGSHGPHAQVELRDRSRPPQDVGRSNQRLRHQRPSRIPGGFHSPVHGLCTRAVERFAARCAAIPGLTGGEGASTAKLVIIGNNCPPLRKSEIEYYAMLAKTGVHHYTGSACPSQCGRSSTVGLGLRT